ncbi:regucalcin-like [Belonocnema kinseyi]|uniref:regucalcin-like n=1 Tax=Belonocnema kinseyi TaxID=2817044 RepID=UPI00143CCA35|nr:regucalcin-like [Belonocnema kinseyi]
MTDLEDCKNLVEFQSPGTPNFVVPDVHNNQNFVIAYHNRIETVKWNSLTNDPSQVLKIFTDINLPANEAINYGIADTSGALWFGTMRTDGTKLGKLWTYYPHPRASVLKEQKLPGIDLSNGIAWHVYNKEIFYCIDYVNNKILSYEYDVVKRKVKRITGIAFDLESWYELHSPRLYYGHARLGRMTIDTKGRLWVPLNGGSHVLQIEPRVSAVYEIIRIPAVKVNACVFGGIGNNVLYVSTLKCETNENCPDGDQGGSIFTITNFDKGVKGEDASPFVFPSLYNKRNKS